MKKIEPQNTDSNEHENCKLVEVGWPVFMFQNMLRDLEKHHIHNVFNPHITNKNVFAVCLRVELKILALSAPRSAVLSDGPIAVRKVLKRFVDRSYHLNLIKSELDSWGFHITRVIRQGRQIGHLLLVEIESERQGPLFWCQ